MYLLRTIELTIETIKEQLSTLSFHKYHQSLEGIDLYFQDQNTWQNAYERLKPWVYATEMKTMEEVIGQLLRKRQWTIATAESCTAGLISARLANVPGSSQYLLGSIVAYSNEIKKQLLKVPEQTLKNHGAVSEKTCYAMLKGLQQCFKSHCGIAVTGIAGPGGTKNKPQGLTFIGVYCPKQLKIQRFVFPYSRNENRWVSSQYALNLLRKLVLDDETF